MSDVKIFNKSGSGKTGKSKRRLAPQVVKIPDTFIFKTSWAENPLSSGSTGNISATFSPSLQYSSERAAIQALFGEIRLIAYEVLITPLLAVSPTASQSYVTLGTNRVYNATTFTLPTDITDVSNLLMNVDLPSTKQLLTRYSMVVPQGLLYLSSADGADVPTVPAPGAGSPGAIVAWGTGFDNNTPVWNVRSRAIFQARGRR